MRHLLKTAVILILLSTSFSCSKEEFEEDFLQENIEVRYESIDLEVLELLNEYRISNGLQALKLLTPISVEAIIHNDFMISENKISHTNFYTRKQKIIEKTNAVAVSEILATGFTSAESVVNAWLNSPSHKASIDDARYNYVGVSTKKDPNGKYYFTNIFAKIN